MKRLIKLFLIILILGFTSCNDASIASKEIIVKGIVLDSLTDIPIPNARVTALTWRKVRFDEETYDKIDTTTDSHGVFVMKFTEGFKVDIGSIAPNYHPTVQEIKDISGASDVKLKLKANTALGVLRDLGQLAVFVRDYDTNPSVPRTYHGINLLKGTNTQSPDSMDIGIESNSTEKYPKVLFSNIKGGIIPFFTVNGSNIAPEEGYVNKYELKGNEKGFFIKCRDGKTYARIMIFSPEYDRSSPYSNGSFKDFGIMFNVELQTEGKEFNSAFDLRLDYYILENI